MRRAVLLAAWLLPARGFVVRDAVATRRDCAISARFVGTRRMLSKPPPGEDEATHALLDDNYNIPILTAYVGAQAALSGIASCPPEAQINPPWYNGAGTSGGLCPVEYWNWPPVAVGVAFFALAACLAAYGRDHRLLVDPTSVRVVKVNAALETIENDERPVEFASIAEWSVSPLGLFVRTKGGQSRLFPLFYDAKSAEALMEEAIEKVPSAGD